MKIFSPILKGTTTVVQGTTNLSGSFTGSLFGTAATASYADNFTVGGTLTAQTINVQVITSSIEFNTGSTRNGALSSNTHQFTGSVLMSGSLTVNGPALPIVIASNSTTELYTEYRYNTSTVVGYIGNGTGVVSIASGSDFGVRAQNNLLFAAGGNNERMRITSTGNVGIGTSSPWGRFNVVVGANKSLVIQDAGIADTMEITNYASSGGLQNVMLSAAVLSLYTGTAGGGSATERMRITSGGNVLIGTSTLGTATGTTDLLTIGKSGSSSTGINFTDGTSTRWGFIYINNAKTVYGSFSDTAFETGASATERMRILANGSVCIGMTTSPYGRVSIKSNSATIYAGFSIYAPSNENFTLLNHDGNVGYIGCDSTATGFATPLAFWINSAIRMTMSTNGSIGAPSGTNIYNASDVRLKKNISTTTYGLDAISLLNPVKFNWVDGFEPTEDGKDMLGFVAQEVQTVIPEAIESFGGNSITVGDTVIDNPLRVNEKFIIPVLVKAIQELKSENDTLKEILQRNNIQ